MTNESGGFSREYWQQKAEDPFVYDDQVKYHALVNLFARLERTGVKVGPIIFNIGGGVKPDQHLQWEQREDAQIFSVDFVAPIDSSLGHIDADINTVTKPETVAYRKKLLEISDSLGIDPKAASKEQVDTMIFSEVLNYVPYQEVLRSSLEFLKPGGVIVIFNFPGRTFPGMEKHLHEEGSKSNDELSNFLRELGLEILDESLVQGKALCIAARKPKA